MNLIDVISNKFVDPSSVFYRPLPQWLKHVLPFGAAAGILLATFFGFRYGTSRLSDFAGYYAAAKIVVTEDSLARMYDDRWFKEKLAGYGMHEPTIVLYVNPPTASLFVISLIWLPPEQAKILWDVISLLCGFGSWTLLISALKVPAGSGHRSLLLLLLLGSLPFLRNIEMGQVYAVMLLLFSMFCSFHIRNMFKSAAATLAVIMLLKLYGWMFLVLFIAQKKWKEFWWTTTFFVIGASACIMMFGADTFLAQAQKIIGMTGGADTASPALRSIVAPFSRLFNYHEQWNPHALVHLPWVQSVVPSLIIFSAIVYTLRVASKDNVGVLGSLLILSVVATPLAADHHYVLLAFPMFLMLVRIDWGSCSVTRIISYGILVYVVLGWWPALSVNGGSTWTYLLDYLRLYGALMLWWTLTRQSARIVNRSEIGLA